MTSREKTSREFTGQAQLNQHAKTKQRHLDKYQKLKDDHGNNFKRSRNETNERWVRNLSSKTLSPAEQSVLTKGLNYAVAPKRLPIVDFITCTESAIHHAKIPPGEAEELRRFVAITIKNAKLPKSNLSKEKGKALDKLKRDRDIVILLADKGRCTVVLDSTTYDSKIQELLNDTKTYQVLKRDPTNGYKERIIKQLKILE